MRIAIVGSGISGMAALWSLGPQHEVWLYEQSPRLGGHTASLPFTLEGIEHAVDTGFMVCNRLTYPYLMSLFRALDIPLHPSDMSLSIQVPQADLTWSGQNFASLWDGGRNLWRPQFWRMLRDVLRFHRLAPAWLEEHALADTPLQDLLQQWDMSPAFIEHYLLPMAAAIWSCPNQTVLQFPAAQFIRFCVNHRLLQVQERPIWYSVRGGAAQYTAKISTLAQQIRTSSPVLQVETVGQKVAVHSTEDRQLFDYVILACHSDQAQNLLPTTDPRRALLQHIRYQNNRVLVHTDARFMPKRSSLWSSWNVATASSPSQPVMVTYWLNRLQDLPWTTPVFETLNPSFEPKPASILLDTIMQHPLLDARALAARAQLHQHQGLGHVCLAGAWQGYGFHEDGLKSGLDVAQQLGGRMLQPELTS